MSPLLTQKRRQVRDRAAFEIELRARLGSGCFFLLFETGFRLSDDRRKCGGVGHGEIREDLAVGFDADSNQAFDEAGVGQAFVTGRSGDTLDPETTELAFPLLAVTVFVLLCLPDGVLCVTEEFRAESAETLRTKEDTLASGT